MRNQVFGLVLYRNKELSPEMLGFEIALPHCNMRCTILGRDGYLSSGFLVRPGPSFQVVWNPTHRTPGRR
jgi:hypothetical protein